MRRHWPQPHCVICIAICAGETPRCPSHRAATRLLATSSVTASSRADSPCGQRVDAPGVRHASLHSNAGGRSGTAPSSSRRECLLGPSICSARHSPPRFRRTHLHSNLILGKSLGQQNSPVFADFFNLSVFIFDYVDVFQYYNYTR